MKTFTHTIQSVTRKIVLSFILVMLASAGLRSQTCQASFTMNTSGDPTIVFTNTSTGSTIQTTYYWDFGDGNYANTLNASNTYMYAGTYYICLYMSDSLLCWSSYCDSVVITNAPPPPCNSSFSAYIDSSNNAMIFYGYSANNPIAWFWDFGDGNNSSLQNPTHIYANPGTYYVCMTAYSLIDTCTFCDSVYYYPCNTTASFTVNTTNDPTINFTNTSTGGYAPYYFWSFGDSNSGWSLNATHTYMYNGTYTVCMTMYDSLASCTTFTCTTITITNGQNIPCSANYVAYPDSFNTGLVYYYDQSTGGPFYSWFWDFGDGFTSTLQNPTHTYAQTGWYYICLTVFSLTDTCTYCDSLYVLKLAGIEELLLNGAINYFPNPSSGQTTIAYTLNESANVTVEIYDMIGNKVEIVVNKTEQNAGNHEIKWNAEGKAEGIYFVRTTINDLTVIGKLTLIK